MRMPISVPLIVTAQIEGPTKTGMVSLVLDTGARYLTLGWSVAEDMGFDPATSQNRVSLITANGIVHAPLIVAPRVRVGDVLVEDVEIVCHDIPRRTKPKAFGVGEASEHIFVWSYEEFAVAV